jgi:Rrf2 family protein
VAELAAAYPDRPVSVRELARNQRLPVKYLEQIMAALKSAGLVRAVRGLHGGYALAASPDTTNLGEVFEALEGTPCLVECVTDPGACPMQGDCPTRDTWIELTEAVTRVLRDTTLQDLADRRRQKSRAVVATYQI